LHAELTNNRCAGGTFAERGYGLVDSPKVDAEPGRELDLVAVVAPSLAAAAQYYLAIYWYSLLEIPDLRNARQITIYDPRTRHFSFIDTCFGTHHLNFAEDANDTLWFSNNANGPLAVVGWVNTKLYWATGDQAKSQGWTALIVDTTGTGNRGESFNEPGAPAAAGKTPAFPSGCTRSPGVPRTARSGCNSTSRRTPRGRQGL
jgi:hypothetical protein